MVGIDIMIDHEDWLLIKNGELIYTSEELDNKTLQTIQRFIGFDIGQQQKEKKEHESEMRKMKLKNR